MSLRSHEAAACAVIAIGVCGVLVGSLLVESMRNGQSSAKATVSTAQSTEEVQAQTEPTQTPAPTPEPEPVVQTVHFSATGDNLIHEAFTTRPGRAAVMATMTLSLPMKICGIFTPGLM